MTNKTHTLVVTAMLLGGVAAPAAARHQNVQVRRQLWASDRYLAGYGYDVVNDVFSGVVAGGETAEFWLDLTPATEYAIVGACDEGCHDLDLRLFDAADSLVGADMKPDDRPVISVHPGGDGSYRVQVRMNDCADRCQYSVGVFGRDARWSTATQLERQVFRQIGRAGRTFLTSGYRQTDPLLSGTLTASGTRDLFVTLQSGTQYLIIGVCDVNCHDLDIRIEDESGNVVGLNERDDDYPVVQLRPRFSGRYRITVRMHRCRTPGSPDDMGPARIDVGCNFGVGLFGRPRGRLG